ncbi:radical SAM/SPASM domain-containing protein [Candidatus Pelagibacter bacterium nBUS_44]|uniref:radical SAM/SPASM domain-containing protein n=1 Tax=Candidatus Pelagibacter bacterium nBUS_44 TaxID=3374195 RepID=UPI003EBDFAA0
MEFKPLLGNDVVNLAEVLPLDVPISLMIDPCNLCNFKCTFCPTGEKSLLGEYKRPKGMMSFKLFEKIIIDISNFQKNSSTKIKSLLLYKDGEPLLNRKLPEMITFAKKLNIAKHVLVTTNASLLDENYSERLLNSGLDTLRVSIQSLKKEFFSKTTRTKLDYDKIKENIKNFYNIKKKLNKKTELIISYVDAENFDENTKKNFIQEFSKFSDRVIINPVMGWTRSDIHDWRNGIDREREIKNYELKVCPDPFSRLSVNFDGSVSVCCVDWSHGTVVGNFNDETFEEVWNGKKLKEFRLLHLNGERNKIGPCKNCDYIKDKGKHDNIDHICQKLIEVYS